MYTQHIRCVYTAYNTRCIAYLKGSASAADPQQAFWPSEGTITPLVVWNQSWQVQYQYCQSLDYVWCVFACGCVCRCDEHMSIAGARCWAGMHHFWRLHTALELTSADESGKLRIGAKWLVSKAQCADYGSELKSERVLLGKISNVHVRVCACIELRGTAIASCSSKRNRYLSLYEVDKLSWMIWAQACNAWSELERSGLRRDQGRHFLCCNSAVVNRSLWSSHFVCTLVWLYARISSSTWENTSVNQSSHSPGPYMGRIVHRWSTWVWPTLFLVADPMRVCLCLWVFCVDVCVCVRIIHVVEACRHAHPILVWS